MATFENIIVGAGPYGLSVAAHLRRANVNYAIVGKPMESWRSHMPIGMALKSDPFASSLSDPEHHYTLERFCRSSGKAYSRTGVPLSIVDFLDYADWFQRRAVPDVWETKLIRLNRSGSDFELTFDDRTVTAKRVILATGHLAFRHIPETLRPYAHDRSGLVSHSADHHDLAKFTGQDVTIVGCGQSALETAALLHELGASVRVLARASRVDWNPELDPSPALIERMRWPEAGLGRGWHGLIYSELPRLFFWLPALTRQRIVATANGPSGAWWLKHRVIDKIPIFTAHEVAAAVERNGRLELSVRTDRDTVRFATDHVIVATGYRVDLNRIPFLDSGLRTAIRTFGGAPLLNSAFRTSVPGLHFVGLPSAFSFGPVMRFVYGTKHAATILTSHIRSFARRKSASPSAALAARTVAR